MTTQATISVELPSGLTSAHVVTIKPSRYSAETAYLSVTVEGELVADTLFAIQLVQVTCSAGQRPDDTGSSVSCFLPKT